VSDVHCFFGIMYGIFLPCNLNYYSLLICLVADHNSDDRLCGLVVRVFGYRSGGPGSIPGTTPPKKSNGSGTGFTQPREYN
jgi:hypothetical protein